MGDVIFKGASKVALTRVRATADRIVRCHMVRMCIATRRRVAVRYVCLLQADQPMCVLCSGVCSCRGRGADGVVGRLGAGVDTRHPAVVSTVEFA